MSKDIERFNFSAEYDDPLCARLVVESRPDGQYVRYSDFERIAQKPTNQSPMYQLGRHDERRRIMQLIGETRDACYATRISESGKALDDLVMRITAEPLEDIRDVKTEAANG